MRCVSPAVFARLAVSTCLVVSLSTPDHARAQQVGPVALEVDGDCAQVDALREAADAELAARGATAEVAVRLRVRCEAVVSIDVTVASTASVHTRRIEVPRAEAATLPEAIALIVGVAIAEWREATSARPAPTPEASPEPSPPGEEVQVAPAPPPSLPQRLSIHVGVHLGDRSPASGLAGELSFSWRALAPVSIELGLLAAPPRDVPVREGTLSLFLFGARLSGCAVGDVARELWLGGCAGLALGGLETRSAGFHVESFTRLDGWLAADLRARAELSVGSLSLRLDALLGVPLWTPSLVVATQDDPRAVVLDFAPVFGGVVASVGIHFFP